MRFIFNLVVSMWDITEFAAVNWIIIGLMSPIPFVISYHITGESAFFMGYNSKLMSFFHWTVRLIVYAVFVHLLKGIIWVVSQPLILFNVSNPRFISSIIIATLTLVIAIFVKLRSSLNYNIFWP